MLLKKLIRDIGRNKSQFLTIFLMVFLGVFVFAGVHAYMDGMKVSAENYYEKNNLQDIWITGENFSNEDLEKVKSIDNVKNAERKLTINTVIEEGDIDLETNFIESNEISKFYVVDGEGFDYNKSGVWIDYFLAKNNDYKVGDEIKIKYGSYELTEEIVGLIEVPDHVYSIKDETEIFPNHNTFGYAYLSINEFPEDYIIDKIMKESKIPDRATFDSYMSDFKASDYYVFPNIIVDVYDVEKIVDTKRNIENEISSALAVTDREDSLSYQAYNGEIEEGQTYSGVFTALFLFIAILSVITTMNRFVKKQRTQIGTLKALGFKKGKIVRHYISYGFYISIIAAISGIILGAVFIGNLFLGMEMAYFEVPESSIIIKPISYVMAIVVILTTTVVTYLSCRKILKEKASETLRVQMPKVKRTKFNFTTYGIFKNASVSTKWNLRDIFRNKSRSVMAIVGVMGCTMLLVCAFGMFDSMNSYISWEFDKICNFDYKLTLSSNYTDEELNDLTLKYGNNTSETLGIEIKNGNKKETNSLVVNDALDYLKYTDHNREYMNLRNDGMYITEKLSRTLGLNIGDTIEWHIFGDDNWYKTEIVGLNRDPQNQNLNTTKEFFESLGLTYKADTIYSNKDLSKVKELEGVEVIQNIDDLAEGMMNMIETMRTMIILLIVVAAILGFVIIYNLGVLSLSEKQYQFATLKVLGFRSKQIKNIFVKQNTWLAIIGLIFGLPFGYFMTDYIFKMALSDSYDFSAQIKVLTYIYAIVGTLLVSFFVNKVLAKKVNTIDMVSSLKGNE